MGKKLSTNFRSLLNKIDALVAKNIIPDKYVHILQKFFENCQPIISKNGKDPCHYVDTYSIFIDIIEEQFKTPYQFQHFHKKICSPFDYYKFGLDFFRPLVDFPHSTLKGADHLSEMETLLKAGENVILFANHQTEVEPQAIGLLLETSHPKFGENLVFVAGSRVTSDPLAIPFSMGCNLLCIYSKKHIENSPEEKRKKHTYNKRTMRRMLELLSEGGYAIYVAPSGGRDRADASGSIAVAPFDPQSVEMFYLMARKADRPTHFFPLALSTHNLLLPPKTTESELGEARITHGGALHLSFGRAIDMENFPGAKDLTDKKEKTLARATYLWNIVKNEYENFPK